jgi:N-acetylglucosamine-6-phosphate deacetylase
MGIDFNGGPLQPEQLHAACRCLRDDGVDYVLATIITDDVDRMAGRLARIAALRSEDPLAKEVIAGFHIEGPFLSPKPGYAGAHPAEHVRPAGLDAMKRLLDAAAGLTRLVTLAPEQDEGLRVTRFVAGQNILVSAGHCDPTLDELQRAIDAGLLMFTHLGNGCPTVLARHDNIVQRVLALHDKLWIMFIGDGVHVPLFALRNYLAVTGTQRVVAVTDCISAAGLGPGRYCFGSQWVEVGEDLVARPAGKPHLMGSTITMPEMEAKLRDELGLDEQQVEQLLVQNPRTVLG